MRTLDLGCSVNVRGPAEAEKYGVEIVDVGLANVRTADLTFERIPFPDNYFDVVYAYDFLEHLPMRVYLPVLHPHNHHDGLPSASVVTMTTRNVMLELFSEIYRVLTPGGMFESFTPHMPNWMEVFRDPTHVSVWTEQTWDYFAGSMSDLTRHYGFRGHFDVVHKGWMGAHLVVQLRAIKEGQG